MAAAAVEPDEVVDILRRAAQQGNAEAMVRLGQMYYNGDGSVGQDYVQSFGWFHEAALLGHVHAQFVCGVFYRCVAADKYDFSGDGIGRNLGQHAVAWFRKAMGSQRPHIQSMCCLAGIYEEGFAELSADLPQARRLLEEIVFFSDRYGFLTTEMESSHISLAQMLRYGLGGDADWQEAIRLNRKVILKAKRASTNRVCAFENLAFMHARGMGTPHDYITARDMFEKASAGGSLLASCALGIMYASGRMGEVPHVAQHNAPWQGRDRHRMASTWFAKSMCRKEGVQLRYNVDVDNERQECGKGVLEAMVFLGVVKLYGLLTEKQDIEKSMSYFRMAVQSASEDVLHSNPIAVESEEESEEDEPQPQPRPHPKPAPLPHLHQATLTPSQRQRRNIAHDVFFAHEMLHTYTTWQHTFAQLSCPKDVANLIIAYLVELELDLPSEEDMQQMFYPADDPVFHATYTQQPLQPLPIHGDGVGVDGEDEDGFDEDAFDDENEDEDAFDESDVDMADMDSDQEQEQDGVEVEMEPAPPHAQHIDDPEQLS